MCAFCLNIHTLTAAKKLDSFQQNSRRNNVFKKSASFTINKHPFSFFENVKYVQVEVYKIMYIFKDI